MIASGSTVKIHYTLTVNGEVADSSRDGDPLEFVQGAGEIIPGLEEQVSGMNPGEKKSLTVAPEKGYGPVDPEAFTKAPRRAFQSIQNLQVGARVLGKQKDGTSFQATVTDIGAEEVVLDLNHPLAGKTLEFDVEVVGVQPPKSS